MLQPPGCQAAASVLAFLHPDEGGEMATHLLSKLPSRLHHNPSWCRPRVNRRFFEDLLGIPLVATWCEKNFSTECRRNRVLPHLFRYADGSASPSPVCRPEMYELTQAESRRRSPHYHIASRPTDTYEELKQRLERAGEKYRETNHGYCKSIYVTRRRLIVEFTRTGGRREIDAVRRSDAHSDSHAGWPATAAPTTSCAAAPSNGQIKRMVPAGALTHPALTAGSPSPALRERALRGHALRCEPSPHCRRGAEPARR